LAAAIFNNVFEGAVQNAIHISAPSVYQTSIGTNALDHRVGKYIHNSHGVEIAPIGYLLRAYLDLQKEMDK
jgi:hypothetical protein